MATTADLLLSQRSILAGAEQLFERLDANKSTSTSPDLHHWLQLTPEERRKAEQNIAVLGQLERELKSKRAEVTLHLYATLYACNSLLQLSPQ